MMNDGVDGERQARLGDPFCDRLFTGEGALVTRDPVGRWRVGILDRKLRVVEPGIGEFLDTILREADPGGDEVGIKSHFRAMRDDVGEILPRRRFAARKMRMQNAEGRGLRKNLLPDLGAEFVLARIERERIGTIGAAERTAMRQFGEKRDRRGMFPWQGGHKSTIRLAASSFSKARTSVSTLARSAENWAARSSTIAAKVAVPSQRFKISTAMASALITRSGASSSHSPRVASYFNLTPRGRRGFHTMSGWLVPVMPLGHGWPRIPASRLQAGRRDRHKRSKGRRAAPKAPSI